MSAKRYYVALLVMAAISIWLRRAILIHLIANASLDDELFIHTARYLKAGHWLGPYNDVTLVKGMMYPLFICATSLAAIPLKVAEQAAYLAAAALTAGACSSVKESSCGVVGAKLLWFTDIHCESRAAREGLAEFTVRS